MTQQQFNRWEDHEKRQKKPKRLALDDIFNSNDPEIKQFMKIAMKEEMNKIRQNASEGMETMERAAAEASERVVIGVAKHFKDRLSPRMQQILAEQYPDPDVA